MKTNAFRFPPQHRISIPRPPLSLPSTFPQVFQNIAGSMEKLAVETLEQIYAEVCAANGRQGLVSWTLMNKTWAKRTTPWLWEHVAVDHPNFDKLMASPGLRNNGHLIQSLTVEFYPYTFPGGPDDVHEWHEQVLKLANVIKAYLKKIKSFSLTISRPGCERTISMFRASAEILGVVLAALPQTCVSLELETNGWELFHGANPLAKEHLCPHIMGMLPRLRHLRVGAASLCGRGTKKSKLSAPHLETMTVAIHPRIPAKRMVRRESSWCYLAHQFSNRWFAKERRSPYNYGFKNLHLPYTLTVDWINGLNQPVPGHIDLIEKAAAEGQTRPFRGAYGPTPPPIARVLTRLRKQGKMPLATKVDVVTYQREQPTRILAGPHSRYPELLVIRDCVADTRQALPIKAVHRTEGKWWMGPWDDTKIPFWTAFMVSKDNMAKLGNFWDLMEDGEEAFWGKTRGNGARVTKDTPGAIFEVVSAGEGDSSRKSVEHGGSIRVSSDDSQVQHPVGFQRVIDYAHWDVLKEDLPHGMDLHFEHVWLWLMTPDAPPRNRVPVLPGATAAVKKLILYHPKG